jgi:hypothetical protein
VPTIGYATHVIARCDLDENVVYKVLKGMVDNKADLAAIAKAMGSTTPKMMAEDIGVPLHKGALKYYKEVGRTLSAAGPTRPPEAPVAPSAPAAGVDVGAAHGHGGSARLRWRCRFPSGWPSSARPKPM